MNIYEKCPEFESEESLTNQPFSYDICQKQIASAILSFVA